MSLLRDLGKGYLHMCRFECREAIECYSNLRSQHFNSGWVLGQVARAFFEKGDYEEAVRLVVVDCKLQFESEWCINYY
jgi:anaphase-promoting complex subunit 3